MGHGVWVRVTNPMLWSATMNMPHAIPTLSFT